MKDTFVHLHVHDEYSKLDGAVRTQKVAQRVAELGQTAVAQTNHGNLFGAYTFHKECRANGVKPILGCEFYVAPGGATRKEQVYWGTNEQRTVDVSRGAYTHLTVLAKNAVGWANLKSLSSRSYSDGFYYEPRIDLEWLEECNEGLFVLSGCMGGELFTRLKLGQQEEANRYVGRMVDIFGKSRFFIEIMDHGIAEERKLHPALSEIAKRFNLGRMATNDSHYGCANEFRVHEAMLCLQTGVKFSDEKRFRFEGSGYYIKSGREMEGYLPDDAIKNPWWVAERVEEYDLAAPTRMPKAVLTKWDTAYLELKQFAADGLREKGLPGERYGARMLYELNVIQELGFEDYFLVLSDIVKYAKSQGVAVGPARGSAGGSLVAYLIGITDLDPIEHGLLFERFLNVDRVSLPDIDIDIDDAKREVFLEYARNKYGEDFTANVATFSTIKARNAIKDSSRILGFGVGTGEELTRRLPRAEFGRSPTLSEINRQNLSDTQKEVLELAEGLENLVRQPSVHASAYVISPEPLVDILPVWRAGGKGHQITQFDQHGVEALGLVKYDFLGLKNLGIIDDCSKAVGITAHYSGLQLNDAKTWKLLQDGDTTCVFQLDGAGMQRLLQSLVPETLGDLAAVLALYRPGPMGANAHREFADRKNGRSPVSYPHPMFEESLSEILGPTYGLIVFQEQVMQLLQKVAGYTLSEADLVRKAMGKKDRALLASEKERFTDGCIKNYYTQQAIDALWDILVPFADYSFVKSHAVGYATVAYRSAYLKANYPKEYMCAVLSREGDPYKFADYLAEVHRMGITILPPSVNAGSGWSVSDKGIHYGLTSVKGLGEKVLPLILKGQPYHSIQDFLKRVPKVVLNVRVMKALIESGSFDALDSNREGWLSVIEQTCEREVQRRAEEGKGEQGLFPVAYTAPKRPVDLSQRQHGERSTLGVSLSSVPLVLTVCEPLSESEMLYLREACHRHPGGSELRIVYASTLILRGPSVEVVRFAAAVAPFGSKVVLST